MKNMDQHNNINKLSFAGLLVTLGIVYGDIGTSPLYTVRAIIGNAKSFNELLIYGSLSCVFWTLTIQTTIKYILITLRADNKGEGGIFSLFALIRRKSAWAAILTMIGIIVNRLNISIIAFKWWIPLSERYLPSWMEIVITLAIIFTEIWVFRWIVTRMPVFGPPPAWAQEKH